VNTNHITCTIYIKLISISISFQNSKKKASEWYIHYKLQSYTNDWSQFNCKSCENL